MSTRRHKITMTTGEYTAGHTCAEVVQHHITHSVDRPCWLVGIMVSNRGLVHQQSLSLRKHDLNGNMYPPGTRVHFRPGNTQPDQKILEY